MNFNKIMTTKGREIELCVREDLGYVFHSDIPRQRTTVEILIDKNFCYGYAHLHPNDKYDYSKAVRVAVTDAIGDLADFTKEDRADIWEGINRLLLAQEATNGLLAIQKFVGKYGPAAFNHFIGAELVKEDTGTDLVFDVFDKPLSEKVKE